MADGSGLDQRLAGFLRREPWQLFTNNFTDIFIVTNNTIAGSLTNYLDIGAATNHPSRYYRARLSP